MRGLRVLVDRVGELVTLQLLPPEGKLLLCGFVGLAAAAAEAAAEADAAATPKSSDLTPNADSAVGVTSDGGWRLLLLETTPPLRR